MTIEVHTIRIRTYDLSWGSPQSCGLDRTVAVHTNDGALAAIELACCAIWGAGSKYSQRGHGEYVLRAGTKRRVRIITTGHSLVTDATQHSAHIDRQMARRWAS